MNKKQAKKYLDFLNAKVQGGTTSNFFTAMHERMTKGIDLTDNMIAKLDEIMERENAPKVQKKFKMSKWWMRANGMYSLALTAVVEVETDRAYLVNGHADIAEGSWCMRCGRELTQPASFTIGFGADCAKKIGIPYPAELNKMSKDEIAEYREKLLGVLKEQLYKGWIPKSQVVEIIG